MRMEYLIAIMIKREHVAGAIQRAVLDETLILNKMPQNINFNLDSQNKLTQL